MRRVMAIDSMAKGAQVGCVLGADGTQTEDAYFHLNRAAMTRPIASPSNIKCPSRIPSMTIPVFSKIRIIGLLNDMQPASILRTPLESSQSHTVCHASVP